MLQKEMEERGIKKVNDYPETRWGYIYMCAKDILEKWDKLYEMKEEIKRVAKCDFFQEITKVTLITLKLALEPLFFALEFLQNDRLNISSFCGIYFGITAQPRVLDSGTNIFAGTLLSELETIIGTTTVSDLSFATLAAALDPFTEAEWMTEGISNKCWDTIKEMASSYQLLRQESEEEEDSAMAALMRSTYEEIETNCRLVRDVIASQKTKRETIIKFEEVFEKWKRGEPIEQIQPEHNEKTFGTLVHPQ